MSASTIAHLRARIYEVLCDGAGVTRSLMTPMLPTGLIGWWELRNATLSAGNVTALIDSSGNGNDLAIAGSGAEVTLLADADYGGELVGVFGGGKYLSRATFTGGAEAQPVAILALGEWTTGDGALYSGALTLARVSGSAFVSGGGAGTAAGTVADATPHAALTVYAGASSSHYTGADWSASATLSLGTDAANGITIGALDDGSLPLTGKVAIVSAWDHAPTVVETKQAAGYVRQTFGQTVAPAEERRFQRLRTSRGDRTRLAQRAKEQPIAHVSIVPASDDEVVDEMTDSHLYRCTVRVTRYYFLGFESDPDSVDATLDRAFDDGCRVRAALSHPANLVTLEDGTATGLGGSSLRPREQTEGDDPDDVGSGADRLLERIDTFHAEFSFDPDA